MMGRAPMGREHQRKAQRKSQLRLRVFHIVIALILVICVLSPYVESAMDLNDSVFATGYDTETTVAILMLLLELVFSLTNLVVLLCKNVPLDARVIVVKNAFPLPELGFGATVPEVSPPLPLRI